MSDRLSFPAGEDRITVYCDRAGAWRWHRKASNNEIISQGEGYVDLDNATVGALRANPDAVRVTPERALAEARADAQERLDDLDTAVSAGEGVDE